MDKRYQVFVSSTFADLQEERQEVMQALLELECIPAGMELFPAANEDQWTLIKKVIDDCDYYIVIVAGRYGSLGPDEISYTEMEYRYAIESGKPVIAFLHSAPDSIPSDQCEKTHDGQVKLAEFCELVKGKVCKFWDSPEDLGGKVSRSVIQLIKNHPAVGWVRADMVSDASAAQEILTLRKQIEELQGKLSNAREQAPKGTEILAQGEDIYTINFALEMRHTGHINRRTTITSIVDISWNNIFIAVSPLLIDEASDIEFLDALDRITALTARDALTKQYADWKFGDLHITTEHFQTIKVQLRALGLIAESKKNRSVKDNKTYWTLTPYGDAVMTRLCAITK